MNFQCHLQGIIWDLFRHYFLQIGKKLTSLFWDSCKHTAHSAHIWLIFFLCTTSPKKGWLIFFPICKKWTLNRSWMTPSKWHWMFIPFTQLTLPMKCEDAHVKRSGLGWYISRSLMYLNYPITKHWSERHSKMLSFYPS